MNVQVCSFDYCISREKKMPGVFINMERIYKLKVQEKKSICSASNVAAYIQYRWTKMNSSLLRPKDWYFVWGIVSHWVIIVYETFNLRLHGVQTSNFKLTCCTLFDTIDYRPNSKQCSIFDKNSLIWHYFCTIKFQIIQSLISSSAETYLPRWNLAERSAAKIFLYFQKQLCS